MPGTFDFTPIRNTALGLLAKFGRDCVLVRSGTPTADSSTPWRVTADGAASEFPFVGPVIFQAPAFFIMKTHDGDQSDCVVYVPGDLGIEPNTADSIRVVGDVNGETDPEMSIKGVQRVDFGGPIMFKCNCTAWVGERMDSGG